jgi:hypothetical protein
MSIIHTTFSQGFATPARQKQLRPRGVTSMIAMMYLVLISSLAVGFYVMTTMSAQISKNDDAGARAYMAASSGMDFMRRQMAKVHIPSGTLPGDAINKYYPNLQTLINGTPNMAGQTIRRDDFVIYIPGDDNGFIKLDPQGNARFRASVHDWDGDIVVKVDGYYGPYAKRSITMDFSRKQRTSSIFDYAIASKGGVVMSQGELNSLDPKQSSIATIFSGRPADTQAITVTGGIIGGKLNLLNAASITVTGGTVDGSSSPANILAYHTLYLDDPPDFPLVDPTVFKKYAVNVYGAMSKKKVAQNILIKKNTNPTFNANDTVQGIMYIESPNKVTFNGDFNLQGFLVMESSGSTTDLLDFKGNLTQTPPPPQQEFDAVRATTGISILAPGAAMSLSGATNSVLKGNVIVDTFYNHGSADVQLDRGSVMTLNPNDKSAWFNGKTVKFTATGGNNAPNQGLSYSTYYTPDPATWQEPTE